MGLFDLLSLFYAFLGVRAIWTLAKNWRAFTDGELTAADRQMASQAAFFVFVPIGVFFHELGHAAATYQFGGTIDWFGGGFHYALFYGYVIPLGHFTPLQAWWIALSGNLVSIVYGFLPLMFLRFTDKAWIKYTIYSFASFQLGWSLVGYPLITLAGFEGDWATIYAPQTWYVGVPLFIVHAALVIVLFVISRSAHVKRWEVSLDAGARDRLRELDAAIAARPGSVEPIVARGNYFAAQAQPDLALADYRAALKLDPQNPRALYNIAQVRMIQKRYTDAEKNFRAALPRAAGDPDMAARVHYGLAACLYQRGNLNDAIAEYDQAIARDSTDAELYFWRGMARRATGDVQNARNDFARAAQLAALSNPPLAAKAREMLTT